MIERMVFRCSALALPIVVLAVVHLQQDVDERATLEVILLEPLVEEVEDREELLLRGVAPATRLVLRPSPLVQSCSRCWRKASTSSSFDEKCR